MPPRQNISYFNSRRVNLEFCGDRKFPFEIKGVKV